jgi:hypothetical protein
MPVTQEEFDNLPICCNGKITTIEGFSGPSDYYTNWKTEIRVLETNFGYRFFFCDDEFPCVIGVQKSEFIPFGEMKNLCSVNDLEKLVC